MTIWKILGHRTAIIYLLTVAFCALASGLILDAFFTNLGSEIHSHFHEMSTTPLEHTSAVVLLAILSWGILKRHRHH